MKNWFSSDRRIGIGLALWAFVVRVIYIWDSSSDPMQRAPTAGLDAQVTWDGASAILDGVSGPIFEFKALSAPFYPWWVTVHRWVFGDSIAVQRVLTAAYAGGRFFLLYLLVRRLVEDRKSAVLATLALSILPSLVYFDTILMKASLDLNLMVLLLWGVTRYHERAPAAPYRAGAALGAMAGVMLMSQLASFLTIGAVLLYVLVLRWPRTIKWKVIGVSVALFASTLVFWKARPKLFDEAGLNHLPRSGVDLRIGLNERSTGHYIRLRNIRPNLWGHAFEFRMAAEVESGKRMTFAEANSFYTRKVIDYAKEHPGHLFQLSLTKLKNFVSDFEFKGADYLYDLQENSSWLGSLPLSYGWFFVFGALGVFALVRQKKWRLLVLCVGLWGAVLAANLITFAMWRFRLPAVIPLTLLGAFAIREFGDVLTALRAAWKKEVPRVVGLVCVGGLALWVSSLPLEKDPRASFMRKARVNRKVSARSEKAAQELANLPASAPLKTRVNLLVRLHRHSRAFALLDQKRDQLTSEIEIRVYVRYLLWLNRYEEAASYLASLRGRDRAMFDLVLRGKGVEPLILRDFVVPLMPG